MDLFAEQHAENIRRAQPLAVRMRPSSLDEFVGQTEFLGDGKLLRRMLLANRLTSAVFYGPPGTGKTTLARIIASHTESEFVEVNASAVGVKEIREILAKAKSLLESTGRRTVLFVDELHRFSRSQQDVLLGDVENGLVILLAATTENPYFAVNTPLLSRSQVFQFQTLTVDEIETVIRRAIGDADRGYGQLKIKMTDRAIHHLAVASDGDARRALTALETAVMSQRSAVSEDTIAVDEHVAAESIQTKIHRSDDDTHYDLASALIKSIRGSDPDAAVYWLARMLESGEDPRFIARRVVIASAEDIGNAAPMGLVLAQAAADATSFVGLPECQLPLAQAVIYLACAPKSNSATKAIGAARQAVRDGRTLDVPAHLRDSHYKGAKSLGHGDGYRYPHSEADAAADQDYLGEDLQFYEPGNVGHEVKMGEYVVRFRAARAEARRNSNPPDTNNESESTP